MPRRSPRYAEELSEAVQKQLAVAYRSKDLVAYALRARLREGYTAKDVRADRIYILDMRHVHAMDVTGMVALASALDRMRRAGIEVIFAAVTDEVKAVFERAGLRDTGKLADAPDLDTAVHMAMVHSARFVRPEKSADARAGA